MLEFLNAPLTAPVWFFLAYVLFSYLTGTLAYRQYISRPEIQSLRAEIAMLIEDKLPQRDAKGRFIKSAN